MEMYGFLVFRMALSLAFDEFAFCFFSRILGKWTTNCAQCLRFLHQPKRLQLSKC